MRPLLRLVLVLLIGASASAQDRPSAVCSPTDLGAADYPERASDPIDALFSEPPAPFSELSVAAPCVPNVRGVAASSLTGTITFQDWDEQAGEWTDTWRRLETYDDDGRRTELITQSLDATGWVNDERWRVAYSVGGGLTEEAAVWDGSGWLPTTRVTTEYSPDSLFLSSLNEEWHAGEWIGTERFEITYDDLGRRIESMQWDPRPGDSLLVPRGRSFTTYSNDGRRSVLTVQSRRGGEWFDTSRLTTVTDGQGRTLTQRRESLTAEGADPFSLFTYDYDGDSYVYVAQWRSPVTGELENRDRRVVEVSKDGLRTVTIEQTWREDAWVNETRVDFTSDPTSHSQETVQSEWDGTAWTLRTRSRVAYVDGRPVSYTQESWDPMAETWRNTLVFEGTYTASGQVLTRTSKSFDASGGLLYMGETVYTYDADGRVISETRSELDPTTQELVFDSRRIYEYDVEVRRDDGPEAALRLAVMPNPAVAGARVVVEGRSAGPVRVDVFDVLGRRVARLHDGPVVGEAAFALPAALGAGVYVVRAEAGERAVTRSVTVVR